MCYQKEAVTLQKDMAVIASTWSEMDILRSEEKAISEETRPALEKAVAGIHQALNVLKDYYAKDATHGVSEGAGGFIITLLERRSRMRTAFSWLCNPWLPLS